jgi:hypothetical protein
VKDTYTEDAMTPAPLQTKGLRQVFCPSWKPLRGPRSYCVGLEAIASANSIYLVGWRLHGDGQSSEQRSSAGLAEELTTSSM